MEKFLFINGERQGKIIEEEYLYDQQELFTPEDWLNDQPTESHYILSHYRSQKGLIYLIGFKGQVDTQLVERMIKITGHKVASEK
jgi:hypothetical protein